MKTIQIFLALTLLLAAKAYPQDSFTAEVESTTVSPSVEDFTTPGPIEDVTGVDDTFATTTESITVDSQSTSENVSVQTVPTVSSTESEIVSVSVSSTEAPSTHAPSSTVFITKPTPTPAPKIEKLVRSVELPETPVNLTSTSVSNSPTERLFGSSSSVAPSSSTTTTTAVPTPGVDESESSNAIDSLLHPVGIESSSVAPVTTSAIQHPCGLTIPHICTQAGNLTHPTDCRRYITCVTHDGLHFKAKEHLCTGHTAFSPILRRCSTDIAHCHEEPECIGNDEQLFLKNPKSNSSFYYCGKQWYDDIFFHKFYIECAEGQLFDPQLKKCSPTNPPGNVTVVNNYDAALWELSKIRETAFLIQEELKKRSRRERKSWYRAQKLAAKKAKKLRKLSKVSDCDSSDEDDA